MSPKAENNRQINLYYNSNSSLGRKCYALAESSGAKVLGIDLTNTKVTGTDWAEIADMLEVKVLDLIDQEHPIFRELYGEKVDLNSTDAMKILEKNPETLIFPIAIRGGQAIQAKGVNDLNVLIRPDTGGIPQPKNHD